jgi:hypothetical protein
VLSSPSSRTADQRVERGRFLEGPGRNHAFCCLPRCFGIIRVEGQDEVPPSQVVALDRMLWGQRINDRVFEVYESTAVKTGFGCDVNDQTKSHKDVTPA